MTTKMWTMLRHFTALALFIAAIVMIGASRDVTLGTAYTICAFELIALWLCYVVLYVFSPVNFIQVISQSFKQEYFDAAKLYTATLVASAILVSVHLLVAGCVFGIYFTKYSPIP